MLAIFFEKIALSLSSRLKITTWLHHPNLLKLSQNATLVLFMLPVSVYELAKYMKLALHDDMVTNQIMIIVVFGGVMAVLCNLSFCY